MHSERCCAFDEWQPRNTGAGDDGRCGGTGERAVGSGRPGSAWRVAAYLARVRVLLIKGHRAESYSDLRFCARRCVSPDTSTCGFVPPPTQPHHIWPRQEVQKMFGLVRPVFGRHPEESSVSASTPRGHADRDKGPSVRGQSRLGAWAPQHTRSNSRSQGARRRESLHQQGSAVDGPG